MSLPIKKFVTIVAGLMIAGAAQAQLLPTWETHITLTQQDLEMIHGAVTNEVHGSWWELQLPGATQPPATLERLSW